MADSGAGERSFPFRPWVGRTVRRALVGGIGGVAVVGLLLGLLRAPEERLLRRAFEVLAAYGLLFLATLLKLWWTAREPAFLLEAETLAYQPLHTFRPRRIPYQAICAAAPRPGTESLRLLVERRGGVRELFLNLGVVAGKHELLAALGERLAAAGLLPVAGVPDGWARPGWEREMAPKVAG